jgi:Ca2+-binding EF-hand superfamily protein
MVRASIVAAVLVAAPAVASAQQPCTSNATQVVASIYQQVLERAPDANAADRARRLANGDVTVRDIVADVAKSQEHSQRFLQPTETAAQKQSAVNYLYKHLLGRNGDQTGVRNYTQRAEQVGFARVVDEMMASPEYSNWFGSDTVPGTAVRWCGTAAARNAAPQPQMRFRGMDINNDGQIVRGEWRGSARSFNVHDWNRDGVLSGEEVKVGGRQTAIAGAERDFSNTWSAEDFRALDGNRDGRITPAEWYFDAESFTRADRNRDRVLTRAEYLAEGLPDDDRGDQFEFIDDDGDGRIERSEWHGSRDAFEWMDRNNDNLLSRAEVVGNETTTPDGFVNIDRNRDGRIQLTEWRWSRRSFNTYDSNNDGVVTRQEFRGGGVATSGR